MGKQRMTALDIRAIVTFCRKNIVGFSVANIYDISNRIYIIKCARREQKYFLLMEAGKRIHVTEWKREKNTMPSAFAMKLRKHIRSRKMTSISQLGGDRVVDMQFGFEENAFHILIELYVAGNVILTDHTYKIMGLLRSQDHSGSSYSVNDIYDVQSHTSILLYKGLVSLCEESIRKCITEILTNKEEGIPVEENVDLNANKENVVKRNANNREHSGNKKNGKDKTNVTFAENTKKGVKSGKNKKGTAVSEIKNSATKTGGKSGKHKEINMSGKSEGVSSKQQTIRTNKVIDNEETKKKKKEKKVTTLSDLASKLVTFAHNELIQHLLISAEIAPTDLLSAYDIQDLTEKMYRVIKEGLDILERFSCEENVNKGYCYFTKSGTNKEKKKHVKSESGEQNNEKNRKDAKENEGPDFIDFSPMLLSFHQNKINEGQLEVVEYDDFNQCVDTFFSKMEITKYDKQQDTVKSKKKLTKAEKIRLDHERRIEQLKIEIQNFKRKAQLIQVNRELVEDAMQLVRTAIATNANWGYIWDNITKFKTQGHVVASRIHAIKFDTCEMELWLKDAEGNAESHKEKGENKEFDDNNHMNEKTEKEKVSNTNNKAQAQKMEIVVVNLNNSVYGNIEEYQTKRKKAETKVEKTKVATEMAMKKVGRGKDKEKEKEKDSKQKAKHKIATQIQKFRKVYWFEKFHWFISSENYLVIAGRDALQNEILYKRYFQKNDIYVHADVHGAASCIIKNPFPDKSIPEKTLLEAGQLAVCRSNAWTQKIITSAWWVYYNQVSKTAPSGEYITTGSFVIRGKKNYLPHVKLEMGFALLFSVDRLSDMNDIDVNKDHMNEIKEEKTGPSQEDNTHNQKKTKNGTHLENGADGGFGKGVNNDIGSSRKCGPSVEVLSKDFLCAKTENMKYRIQLLHFKKQYLGHYFTYKTGKSKGSRLLRGSGNNAFYNRRRCRKNSVFSYCNKIGIHNWDTLYTIFGNTFNELFFILEKLQIVSNCDKTNLENICEIVNEYLIKKRKMAQLAHRHFIFSLYGSNHFSSCSRCKNFKKGYCTGVNKLSMLYFCFFILLYYKNTERLIYSKNTSWTKSKKYVYIMYEILQKALIFILVHKICSKMDKLGSTYSSVRDFITSLNNNQIMKRYVYKNANKEEMQSEIKTKLPVAAFRNSNALEYMNIMFDDDMVNGNVCDSCRFECSCDYEYVADWLNKKSFVSCEIHGAPVSFKDDEVNILESLKGEAIKKRASDENLKSIDQKEECKFHKEAEEIKKTKKAVYVRVGFGEKNIDDDEDDDNKECSKEKREETQYFTLDETGNEGNNMKSNVTFYDEKKVLTFQRQESLNVPRPTRTRKPTGFVKLDMSKLLAEIEEEEDEGEEKGDTANTDIKFNVNEHDEERKIEECGIKFQINGQDSGIIFKTNNSGSSSSVKLDVVEKSGNNESSSVKFSTEQNVLGFERQESLSKTRPVRTRKPTGFVKIDMSKLLAEIEEEKDEEEKDEEEKDEEEKEEGRLVKKVEDELKRDIEKSGIKFKIDEYEEDRKVEEGGIKFKIGGNKNENNKKSSVTFSEEDDDVCMYGKQETMTIARPKRTRKPTGFVKLDMSKLLAEIEEENEGTDEEKGKEKTDTISSGINFKIGECEDRKVEESGIKFKIGGNKNENNKKSSVTFSEENDDVCMYGKQETMTIDRPKRTRKPTGFIKLDMSKLLAEIEDAEEEEEQSEDEKKGDTTAGGIKFKISECKEDRKVEESGVKFKIGGNKNENNKKSSVTFSEENDDVCMYGKQEMAPIARPKRTRKLTGFVKLDMSKLLAEIEEEEEEEENKYEKKEKEKGGTAEDGIKFKISECKEDRKVEKSGVKFKIGGNKNENNNKTSVTFSKEDDDVCMYGKQEAMTIARPKRTRKPTGFVKLDMSKLLAEIEEETEEDGDDVNKDAEQKEYITKDDIKSNVGEHQEERKVEECGIKFQINGQDSGIIFKTNNSRSSSSVKLGEVENKGNIEKGGGGNNENDENSRVKFSAEQTVLGFERQESLGKARPVRTRKPTGFVKIDMSKILEEIEEEKENVGINKMENIATSIKENCEYDNKRNKKVKEKEKHIGIEGLEQENKTVVNLEDEGANDKYDYIRSAGKNDDKSKCADGLDHRRTSEYKKDDSSNEKKYDNEKKKEQTYVIGNNSEKNIFYKEEKQEEEEEEYDNENEYVTEKQMEGKEDSDEETFSDNKNISKGKPTNNTPGENLKNKRRKKGKQKESSETENRKGKKCSVVSKGGRNKKKKMYKKYKEILDDDPEERNLHLKIIGGKKMKGESGEKTKEKGKENVEIKKSELYKSKKPQNNATTNMVEIDEEEMKVKMDELSHLTCAPTENDDISFAIPMCAPFSALQNHKYKIKLVPGNTKKGKVAESCISHFIKNCSNEKEMLLIKNISMDELGNCIIENSTPDIPGFKCSKGFSKGKKK